MCSHGPRSTNKSVKGPLGVPHLRIVFLILKSKYIFILGGGTGITSDDN